MSSSGTTVPTTVVQPCWVDAAGNIKVNGRSAVTLVLTFQQQDGTPIDVSGSSLEFEIEDAGKIALVPVPGEPSQQQLFLDQDAVATVGVSPNPKFGPPFVFRDVSAGGDDAVVLWEGMFIVRGYTDDPPTLNPFLEPAGV